MLGSNLLEKRLPTTDVEYNADHYLLVFVKWCQRQLVAWKTLSVLYRSELWLNMEICVVRNYRTVAATKLSEYHKISTGS